MAIQNRRPSTGKNCPSLTSVQIAALTGLVGGEVIYDTTINKLRKYEVGIGWVEEGAQGPAGPSIDQLLEVAYGDGEVGGSALVAGDIIVEVIAYIKTKNNGTNADAAIVVGTSVSPNNLVPTGQINPYDDAGTRYSFGVFHVCAEGETPEATMTPDTTPATAGEIDILFRVSRQG